MHIKSRLNSMHPEACLNMNYKGVVDGWNVLAVPWLGVQYKPKSVVISWLKFRQSCTATMSMSKTFIGGAVCREFESEAPCC